MADIKFRIVALHLWGRISSGVTSRMSVKLHFSQDPCMPGYPCLSSQRQELYVPTSHPKALCHSVPLCARCFPLWLFLSHERKSQVHLPQQISGSPLGRAPRRISISGTHGMCAGDCPACAEPHTALVQSPAGAGGTCPLPPRSRKLFHVLMCIFRMLMAEGSVV